MFGRERIRHWDPGFVMVWARSTKTCRNSWCWACPPETAAAERGRMARPTSGRSMVALGADLSRGGSRGEVGRTFRDKVESFEAGDQSRPAGGRPAEGFKAARITPGNPGHFWNRIRTITWRGRDRAGPSSPGILRMA